MPLETEISVTEKRQAVRVRQWMDLLSALLMAAATVATAYSAYQSSLWNGEQMTHKARSTTAVVRVGKLSNLALQRTSVHVNLFVHWVSAVNKDDNRMADFLFVRFPEPLRAAAARVAGDEPVRKPRMRPHRRSTCPNTCCRRGWRPIVGNESLRTSRAAGEHASGDGEPLPAVHDHLRLRAVLRRHQRQVQVAGDRSGGAPARCGDAARAAWRP